MATARLILALSVIWLSPAHHGDIPAEYTKVAIDTDSDIFMYPQNSMELTEEERSSGSSSTVLKMQRSLYRLTFENMLHAHLLVAGYTRCKTGPCLYYIRR
jgi:hypothetical protein